MTVLLLLSMVAGLTAAGFDSPGLGLIAAAGLTWAAALSLCTVVPVVGRGGHPVNEPLAEGLSTVATLLGSAGTLLLLAAVL